MVRYNERRTHENENGTAGIFVGSETRLETADAVDAACSDCIENDILKEYLLKHRSEVKRMLLLTEYNPKKQRELDQQDAKEEGQDRVNRLNRKLIELNRQEDIIRAAMEPEYQEKLFREFEI